MILSDRTLRLWMKQKRITISPLMDEQIQSASIDLRLGTHFLTLKQSQENDVITMDTPTTYESTESEDMIIPPLSFMLATTLETIKLPGYITAFVEGRSSVGRMGLFIQNAGWVDPGFEGKRRISLRMRIYNV
ncbi:dCTP deaminase [Paenibacillus sp. JGP012]|uniref:dCTP deaminase n=1 Tax=Paenibacillus sp. JGP012 TaxID=2735914 RepID=UPI00161F84F5|nr:dCTP deaminase [Paenibacillus sp. JGP012]MBB6023772.1 dCTP deaminase [Paenibacillus sp. JGP012]